VSQSVSSAVTVTSGCGVERPLHHGPGDRAAEQEDLADAVARPSPEQADAGEGAVALRARLRLVALGLLQVLERDHPVLVQVARAGSSRGRDG